MNSVKLLKMADGGAIEKIPPATAVPSSIKHQKKPLKEEGERAKRRATQALKRAQQAKEAQN